MGEIPETSYHCGPIEDETIPLVNDLLKLHEFGLITNGDQPYEHEGVFKLGKEMAEYQQRSYVSFMMSGDDQSLKFFATLRNRQEIVVQACEIHPYKVLPNSHEQVSISRERIAERVKDLKTTERKDVTWVLSKVNIPGEEYYYLDIVKRLSPLLLAVAASEWEVPLDLLGLIEEVAVACGLPRIRKLAYKEISSPNLFAA